MSINCLFKLLLLHVATIKKTFLKPINFGVPQFIIKTTIIATNQVF